MGTTPTNNVNRWSTEAAKKSWKQEELYSLLQKKESLQMEHDVFRNDGREKTIRFNRQPIIPKINHNE